MAYTYTPDMMGSISIKETSNMLTAQYDLPAGMVRTNAPWNKVYPPMVNANSWDSAEVAGKRMPNVNIMFYAHPSIFTAAFLNNLIMNLFDNGGNGTVYQTAGFGIQLNNIAQPTTPGGGTAGFRNFDVCRCDMIQISQDATGGPIGVVLDFQCLGSTDYPDYEPLGTSFVDATPVYGELDNVTSVSFGSSATADYVKGFVLTLMRPQQFVCYDTGTYYCQDIASGKFAGTLMLPQSPIRTLPVTEPTGTGTTMSLVITSGGVTVDFTLYLSVNSLGQPQTTDVGTQARLFRIVNIAQAGTAPYAPIVIAAS